MNDLDFESMSDDELMALETTPPAPGLGETVENDPEMGSMGDDSPAGEDPVSEADPSGESLHHVTSHQVHEGDEPSGEPEDQGDEPADTGSVPEGDPAPAPEAAAPEDNSGGEAPADPTASTPEEVDYKAAYEAVMAPFKANGRDMAVHNPEEVRRLMQMGANYTQKMQALAPNMKMMRMLDNNGLLDESKLNNLIDIANRDPNAIQSLLHEAKIDPLDLDMAEAPNYQPGNHTISDQENSFRDSLEVAQTTQEGREAITLINTQWDQASKEALYKQPQILQHLIEHRASGVFDTISTEVERQRMLGNLDGVPFIQAYNQVGDILHSNGTLAPAPAAQETPAPTPAVNPNPQPAPVLETRPAQVRTAPSNSAQVKAASAPRSQPKPAVKAFDPMSMTDEEIENMARPPV